MKDKKINDELQAMNVKIIGEWYINNGEIMDLLKTNEQWQTNNRKEAVQINDRQVTKNGRQTANNYDWKAHIQQWNYLIMEDKQVMNNMQLKHDQWRINRNRWTTDKHKPKRHEQLIDNGLNTDKSWMSDG